MNEAEALHRFIVWYCQSWRKPCCLSAGDKQKLTNWTITENHVETQGENLFEVSQCGVSHMFEWRQSGWSPRSTNK